ncbi:MAG: RNB domain-containing ribonuclease, partial [Paludibacteraceae bacterium]|nr:RNB domain-containing ribonuclease [Paludibacteraceae bacterium]
MPKSSKKGLNRKQLEVALLDVMRDNPTVAFNYKQISSAIGAKSLSERQLVISILDALAANETVDEVERGKYKLNTRAGYVEGVIDRRSNGKTYLVPDDGGSAIFIAERRLRHALNKDRVRVFLYARPKGSEPEGEVVEIIKRAQDTFVGVLQVGRNYAFLRVDNKILTNDIFIPVDNLHGGKDGQKAIVKIVEWGVSDRSPIGEVIDVLGNVGDNNTEMHAILAEYGLPYSYPEALEKAADEIPTDLTPEEFAKRRDMRDVPTFTIDPKDAKDFDDALSIRQLESGDWEIGVHIADVTHYVRPDSPINKEAMERATSVYLVDRTIPMLPEHLSNELCSLRPNEEKLCFSVVFVMDDNANVKHYDICRTVIKSDRRFCYEEAQEVIETGEGDMKEEILKLDSLAKKLRDARFKAGAISFESAEVRFEIDEKGKPLSVYFKESKDANKLIEEFMLLANRTVATHIGKPSGKAKPKTFVYR